MGIYFNMIISNGEVIIENWKKVIGNIESEILREKGEIEKHMEIDKEYYLDIDDVQKIICYYEKMIDGLDDNVGFGDVGIIRHQYIPKLKRNSYSDEKYIVSWR